MTTDSKKDAAPASEEALLARIAELEERREEALAKAKAEGASEFRSALLALVQKAMDKEQDHRKWVDEKAEEARRSGDQDGIDHWEARSKGVPFKLEALRELREQVIHKLGRI